MQGTSSSSFPVNYVTLKDLQERWINRKQDEENEAKLRRLQEEEEIKPHRKMEAKNHQPKSKNPTCSAKQSISSPAASASHSQRRGRKEKNLANEGNVKKPIDAKSETSKGITGRRRVKKPGSGRSRIPPSQSESVVEIGHKREKKMEKGLVSAREDRMAEICRKVEDISVAVGGNRRDGRISRGGGFRGRRGGGTARVSASGAGMVWVRKTTEG